MFSAFAGTVFVALILFGTVAICYCIMLKLLLPKADEDYYIFLPCNENSTDVRKKAYALRIKTSLCGDEAHSKIIVVDGGMDVKERERLAEICKDANGIYIIEKEHLKDFTDGRF